MGIGKVEKSPWTATGETKRAAVRDMFAEIAPRYDLMNSLMSFRLHYRWRAAAVRKLNLKSDAKVLDVCCGTGDFVRALRAEAIHCRILGIDICRPMLSLAKEKFAEQADYFEGDACQLPVLSESFDAVCVGWGIRNVPNIDQAHAEAFRALKPGGRFVSVDMAKPQSKIVEAPSRFIFHKLVPWLGHLFGSKPAYTYLPKSTDLFMTREELSESMRKAGFVDVEFRDQFLGQICIHWGRKP